MHLQDGGDLERCTFYFAGRATTINEEYLLQGIIAERWLSGTAGTTSTPGILARMVGSGRAKNLPPVPLNP